MSHSGRSRRRRLLPIAGAVAAVALVVRGILDWGHGGEYLLLVAVALIAALLLRRYVYRD